MGATLHPLRDTFPIPHKARKSLKKQMIRWLRRLAKKHTEEVPRKPRYKGWYW